MPKNEHEQLVAQVGQAVQAYQRSTDAFDDVVAQVLKINRTDLRCLDCLFGGQMAAGDLAGAVGLSISAMTTLLDRLERRGFVRRVADPADRRRVLVEMTETGTNSVWPLYAPLAKRGAAQLKSKSDTELTLLREFFVTSRELTDQLRAQLRDAKAG